MTSTESAAPQPAAGHRLRIRLAVVTIVVAVAVVAAVVASRGGKPSREEVEREGVPSVLVHKTAGFRYEYHVPSGSESLYDDAKDVRGVHNLLQGHEAQADECRRALEQQYGVKRLEDLRARYEETIRRLKALGYL